MTLADSVPPSLARDALSGLLTKGLLADKASVRQLSESGSLEGLHALFRESLVQLKV